MFRILSHSRVRRPEWYSDAGRLSTIPSQVLIAGSGQQRRGIAWERGRHLHAAGQLKAEILEEGTAQHVRAASEVLTAGAPHIENDPRDRHRGVP
jgi:hypothetical protein